MLKHKKILSILMVLPLFAIASCAKVKEDYKVHQYSKNPEEVDAVLKVTGDLANTKFKNGDLLVLDGLTINVKGEDVTDKRKNKDNILEGGFFVCSNQTIPSKSVVGTDYKATTNVESLGFTFYIATAIQVEENYEIYVSKPFKVTITNSDAIKPWVWFVVTGVVIFGVVAMIFFTRHYKAKKEGKI